LIGGDSTQHRGVRPDIVFPTVIDNSEQGERSLDNALPWAKVAPADYQKATSGRFNLVTLRNRHQSRIAKDEGFIYLIDTAESINHLQEQKSVSLSEKLRRNERNNRREHALEFENKFRKSRGLEPLTLKDKDKDEDDDLVDEDEDKDPVLKIQLDEAANILGDYILMERGNYAATRALQ
jgi:carboxyl-terminal processing protease